MDELLGALHEEGALDSSGAFTMARHAREKLRRFQLLEPQRCVLQFVAAAVAANATSIEVRGVDDELELRYDGFAPNDTELRRLLDYLFQGDGAPAIQRELAVGVNTALELADKVVIESWEGQQGYRITYRIVGEELEAPGFRLTHCPWGRRDSGCRIRVKFKEQNVGLMESLVGSKASKRYVDLIARHCSHAPVPLQGERHDLRPALIFRPALGLLRVTAPGLRLPECQRDALAVGLEREATGRCAAWLALRPERGAGVRWVHRGVTLRLDHKTFSPHVEGVIYCDHLRKNISFTDVVEDEEFSATVEELQGGLKELIWAIVESGPGRREALKLAPLVRSLTPDYPSERWPVLNAWLLAAARSTHANPLRNYTERLALAGETRDVVAADAIRRYVLEDLAATACRDWSQRGLRVEMLDMVPELALSLRHDHDCEALHKLTLLAALLVRGPLVKELSVFVKSLVTAGLVAALGDDPSGALACFKKGLSSDHLAERAACAYAVAVASLAEGNIYEAQLNFQRAENLAVTPGQRARAVEGQFYTLPLASKPSLQLELQHKLVALRARTAGEAIVYYHLEERRLAWLAHDFGTWASHDVERFRAGWDPQLQFYLRNAEDADPARLVAYLRDAETTLLPVDPWLAARVDIVARQLARQACWAALQAALYRQQVRHELLAGLLVAG